MKTAKRFAVMLLCLSLLCPAVSVADTATHEQTDRAGFRWCVTTYDGTSFPAEILQALTENALTEYTPESGVTLTEITPEQQGTPSVEWNVAVCVLVKEDMRWLAMLEKPVKNNPQGRWELTLLSDRAVLQNREYTLDCNVSYEGLGQSFDFTYPCADGTKEIYHLTWGFSDHSLWRVECYDHMDADGRGVRIVCDYPRYGYAVSSLPQEWSYYDAPETFYPCYLPLYFNWTSIEQYPTTEAQAKQLSESSMAAYPSGYAMIWGEVNLREKPSARSHSLGKYYAGTLGEVLSTSLGKDAPWYQVRIGSVTGYVSGVYVSTPQDESFREQLWHGPLSVAKTLRECSFTSAKDNSVTLLPAGTEMQVMGYTENGMLHVMIPGESITWQMDLNGTDGYISKNDVELRVQP